MKEIIEKTSISLLCALILALITHHAHEFLTPEISRIKEGNLTASVLDSCRIIYFFDKYEYPLDWLMYKYTRRKLFNS